MEQEQCWWKALLVGTGMSCGIAAVCFGGYHGGKYLYEGAKDFMNKHVPPMDMSRWVVAANDITDTPVASKPVSTVAYHCNA